RLWACRALLVRALRCLESGDRAEKECDLARIALGWLRSETALDAGAGDAAAALGRALIAAGNDAEPSTEPFALAAPDVTQPGNAYQEFMENGSSYDFGGFLTRSFEPAEPGYCPEMTL